MVSAADRRPEGRHLRVVTVTSKIVETSKANDAAGSVCRRGHLTHGPDRPPQEEAGYAESPKGLMT